MNRRSFIKLTGAFSVAGTASAQAKLFGGKKKPNIVLIMADDLGWKELGCYGQKLMLIIPEGGFHPFINETVHVQSLRRHYTGILSNAPLTHSTFPIHYVLEMQTHFLNIVNCCRRFSGP